MSEELQQHVNKKPNRNWVRAALGLRYFKQGFEHFIDTQIRCHHANLFKRLRLEGILCFQCDQCTSENLLPDHSNQKKCIQKNRRHCFCSQPSFRRQCPNKICSLLYDYIVKAHSTNDPILTNTNPTNWLTDYWELGKCFLSSPGYVDKKSAAETDATGLLSIAINNTYIQDRMDTDIESLVKVRDIRNYIHHSASLALEDHDVIKYIDAMIHVLQDRKAFVSDTAAQDAILHLNELKSVQCHISFEDELEVRKQTLKAIEEMTQDAVCRIRSTEANVIGGLNEYMQEQRDQIKKLLLEKANLTKQSSSVKHSAGNETESQATKENSEKQLNMSLNEDKQSTGEMPTPGIAANSKLILYERRISDYSNDKKQMQAALIDVYKQSYIKTDITPLLPEVQIDVDRVYATPQLYVADSIDDYMDLQHEYYNIYGDTKKKRFKVSEFLTNIVKGNILITADAGMGKTALCRQMMSAWCTAHENSSQCPNPTRSDTTSLSYRSEEQRTNSWCSYFCEIDFLFFISLKYCDQESTIEEMILKHLIKGRYRDSLYRLLEYEKDNCLVILEDLNEWSPPSGTRESPTTSMGLPLKQVNSRYATIYTTRPWKLATIRPKSGEFDMIVELEGIDPESSDEHIRLVFQYINKMTHRRRYIEDFLVCLEDRTIKHLKTYPLLSKLLLSLWCEKSTLNTSLAEIYSAVVDLLISQADRNGVLSHLNICNDKAQQMCNMMTVFADKRYVKKYFDSVVLPLAKFSFRLCHHKSYVCYVFETTDLSDYGLTEDKLKLFSAIGILSERTCYGKSVLERCKTISFIHQTFQEFFTAVYLSIHPTKFKEVCSTTEGILNMSLVFRFLGGISFCALQKISLISLSVVDDDANCRDYRCGKLSFTGFIIELQRMFLHCIKEARQHNIKIEPLALRDVYLGRATAEYMSEICDIKFCELRSLTCDIDIPFDTQAYITQAQQLSMIVCTNSKYLSDCNIEYILRHNEHSLKCLNLSGKCLNEFEIQENMFKQLCRLNLSNTKISCSQFTYLITNPVKIDEVQLHGVKALVNRDAEVNVVSNEPCSVLSSLKHLQLRNCGNVFNRIRHLPCLESLTFEHSSPQVLVEILDKRSCLMTLIIQGVNFGSDENLPVSISKLRKLKLLHLQTVKVSQKCLSKLLYEVGSLPLAVLVKLKDIKQEEEACAENILQHLKRTKLFFVKEFRTKENRLEIAEMTSHGAN
ncbi:uncharacterized protein LOC123543122 [Mercenaria mercenaria]|uniref:uncharacterized protein LOC123543122 n=1 Tax=Mercenaria mercenaria TaxID=6596 RepID=UPI00234EE0E5|nr:uncharacterized protein LOC123543122 [Mercenaria mercenaria]